MHLTKQIYCALQCEQLESWTCTVVDQTAECIPSFPNDISDTMCDNASRVDDAKPVSLETTTVKTASNLHKTSKKTATKSDSKVKDVSPKSVPARLPTSSERRPSAPVVMRDAPLSSTVRQPRKNSMTAGTTIQLQATTAASNAVFKQGMQPVNKSRGLADLGRSVPPPIAAKGTKSSTANESTRPPISRVKQGTSVQSISNSQSQLSASRQSLRSSQGNSTPSGSHPNVSKVLPLLRTSSPLHGGVVADANSHASDDSSRSQLGSVSDLSSLNASHNSISALSGGIANLHLSTSSSGDSNSLDYNTSF